MKKISVCVIALITLMFVSHALADPVVAAPPPTDVGGDSTSSLINFLTTGQYLPAIGALLTLIVGSMRATLGSKVVWFKTRIGGYTLAYVTAVILYVGLALEQSQPITLHLCLMGAIAALTASGILNHFRDITDSMAKPPQPPVPPAAVVSILLLLVPSLIIGCSSCGPKTHQAEQVVVDCVKSDQGQIVALSVECGKKAPDWKAVEACVVAALPSAGWQVGGCVIAGLAQEFLTKKGAARDTVQSKSAHDALESYRKDYGHDATYHTDQGDL